MKTSKAIIILMAVSLLITTGIFIHENIYDIPSRPDGFGTIINTGLMYFSIFFCLLSAVYFTFRGVVMLMQKLSR